MLLNVFFLVSPYCKRRWFVGQCQLCVVNRQTNGNGLRTEMETMLYSV